MKGLHVLVLGGHGFIGRHVCAEFAGRGARVIGLGHGDWPVSESTRWGLAEWHCADVHAATLEHAVGDRPLAAVVHCAGGGSVGAAYSEPLRDLESSVASTAAVLDWLRRRGDRGLRLVLASSAAVYGDQGDVDATETATRAPISPYGYHKLLAETLCDSYSRFFEVQTSVVRLFSVYGEGLRKQLLWDAMQKLARGDATFFGTGHELRDWIHVSDAASLLCAAAAEPQVGSETYNGGNEHATTRQVLTALARHADSGLMPLFTGEAHTGNPRRLTGNSRHARRQLGWRAKVGLNEGLLRYARWFASMQA